VSYNGEKPLHLEDGLRKIEGEGMPIFEKDQNKPTEFGDLYIQFRVVLPDTITPENLLALKQICAPLLKSVEVGEEDKVVKKTLIEVSEEERLAFGEDLTDDEDESDYSDLSEDESEEEEEETEEGEEVSEEDED
jgi:DnaJ-class molecular chaperone